MRVSIFMIAICLASGQVLLAKKTDGQSINEVKITIGFDNETLERSLKKIEKKTGFLFAYQPQLIRVYKNINLPVQTRTVSETLKLLFTNTNLSFRQEDNNIIIFRPKNGENINQVTQSRSLPNIPLQGSVKNQKGEAVIAASVVIKGTTIGTKTDNAGKFRLEVPDDQPLVLIISAIGYKTQTYPVNGQSAINIILEETVTSLNDIVVVGYGQEKKINLTGAVVSIGSEQIENRGVANISNILAGQVPGLTVLQRGGPPGRDAGSLNIRGIGTLGNANPLIIVDGIQTNDYTQIDPNDIASISVLKDAASSAIYGINAANGVIIITTKRGNKGKLKVDYNFQIGRSDFVNLPSKVNAYDLALLYDEAQTNDGVPSSSLKFSASDLQKFKDGSDPLAYANSDWISAIFSKPGLWMYHNLTLSGGTDDTKYNVSFGYLDQDGIMVNTGYKRYNFRTNFDQKISNNFNVGFNLALSARDVSDPPTNQGVGGETWYLHEAFQQWANDPIKYPDGRWAYPTWSGLNHNPVAYTSTAAGHSGNNDNRFMGTAFAEYKIIDGLKLKGIVSNIRDYNYGSNLGLGVDLYRIDPITGTISATPEASASMPTDPSKRNIAKTFYKDNNLTLQALLTYEKAFKKHEVKALLGFEQRKITAEIEGITRINLSDPSLTDINAADPTNQTTYGSTTDYRARSFFGRLNYDYNGKYLFEANLRNDATSRFAAGKRSSLFPSFSAGWNISKENFFKAAFISNLKIRASWGILGNEQIGDYMFLSTYALNSFYIFDGTRFTGISEGSLANTNITWEKTTAKNIGLDVAFLKNKLTISGDYYIRDTKGILLQLNQPAILGASPPVVNAGSVRNKGFEIIAGYKDQVGKVGYYVNANFSKVKNEITDLAGTEYPGRELGDPIDNIFGYEAEGLFQNQTEIDKHPDQSAIGIPKPGDIMYKDINGDDGKIDDKDRKNLGSYFPAINYGFSYGVNYKGFDISMLWQGVAQVKASLVGDAGSRLAQPFGDFGSSPIEAQLDRWTPDGKNPDARFPRESFSASYNYVESSWWVVNTSFLKLRNAQIGYTIPASLLQKIKVYKLRIYVSGENLITISPFKILDPESLTSGDPFFGYSGYTAYPTTKRFMAGISLTF